MVGKVFLALGISGCLGLGIWIAVDMCRFQKKVVDEDVQDVLEEIEKDAEEAVAVAVKQAEKARKEHVAAVKKAEQEQEKAVAKEKEKRNKEAVKNGDYGYFAVADTVTTAKMSSAI